MANHKQSMATVGARDAQLLILGSLPGDASLAVQHYYAHPTNQFWRLLGAAIGEALAILDHDARIARLVARRIALWDVVADATRAGSLDSAIRDARTNRLADYVAAHPDLRAIAFNGKTAASIGRRALGDVTDLMLIELPSSSAAFTRAYADKLRDWTALGDFAG